MERGLQKGFRFRSTYCHLVGVFGLKMGKLEMEFRGTSTNFSLKLDLAFCVPRKIRRFFKMTGKRAVLKNLKFQIPRIAGNLLGGIISKRLIAPQRSNVAASTPAGRS